MGRNRRTGAGRRHSRQHGSVYFASIRRHPCRKRPAAAFGLTEPQGTRKNRIKDPTPDAIETRTGGSPWSAWPCERVKVWLEETRHGAIIHRESRMRCSGRKPVSRLKPEKRGDTSERRGRGPKAALCPASSPSPEFHAARQPHRRARFSLLHANTLAQDRNGCTAPARRSCHHARHTAPRGKDDRKCDPCDKP